MVLFLLPMSALIPGLQSDTNMMGLSIYIYIYIYIEREREGYANAINNGIRIF
jgi:hypothetical protein